MGELRKETASPGGRPRGAGRGIVAPAPPGPRPTAPGGAVGETQAQAEARGSLASRRTTPAHPAPAARSTDQGVDGWTDGYMSVREAGASHWQLVSEKKM